MDALILIAMLVVITIVHEAAHAAMALVLGYKLNKLYLGIPLNPKIGGKVYSTTVWKKKIGNVEYGISWLILGGAVDFDDLDEAPFWKMSLIAVAGPLSNLMLAFFAVCIFAGPAAAWTVVLMISEAVLTGLGMIAQGQVAVSQLSGPVGFASAMSGVASSYPLGWLVVWTLINVALAITNLIPIPALDGGQILMSFVRVVLGKKSEKPIRIITYFFLYILCALMVVVCAKDIWIFFVSIFML